MSFAKEFSDILESITVNQKIGDRMIDNVKTANFVGKIFEGGRREGVFRMILSNLFQGNLTETQAKNDIEKQLERSSSPHWDNNQVFPLDWVERNYRTQLSRFYNQAVLEHLEEKGERECYVYHATNESSEECIYIYAGKNHPVVDFLVNLIASYNNGDCSAKYKLPAHASCNHVVHPV